jgi:hypothetical protein
MRMIMGLDRPTSGTVTVNSKPYGRLSTLEPTAELYLQGVPPTPERELFVRWARRSALWGGITMRGGGPVRSPAQEFVELPVMPELD